MSATRILLGGVAFVATQIAPLISVAFAATLGAGRASVYWYAAMLVVLLNAALSSPISVVFAPVVARDFASDRAAAAALTLRAFRAASTLAVPAVAALCLLGPQPAEWLLTKLSQAEIDDIFTLLLVLSPAVLAAQLMAIPLLVVLAEGRLVQLAKWTMLVLAGHAALTAAVVALDVGLFGIAVVGTISAFALSGAIVVLGLRAHALALPAGLRGPSVPSSCLLSWRSWCRHSCWVEATTSRRERPHGWSGHFSSSPGFGSSAGRSSRSCSQSSGDRGRRQQFADRKSYRALAAVDRR